MQKLMELVTTRSTLLELNEGHYGREITQLHVESKTVNLI